MLKKAPYNVSPYEIKASRLFDNFRGDNRAFTAEEWDNMNLGQQMFEKIDQKTGAHSDITLGRKGEDNNTYKVNEFMATKQDLPTNLRHQMSGNDEVYTEQSQLGWNRVHQDTVNGKPTTVLNELQSY